MNAIQQHSPAKSILLHLLPGIFVIIAIIVFSQPLFSRALGIDDRLSPVVGYLLGILIGLLPVQIGILLFAGKKETGKFTLRNVIQFTEKSRLKEYFHFVPIFILYFLFLFIVIAPLIQPYIVNTFFSWWPQQYNFQLLLQDPTRLAGYRGIEILVTAYLVLSCMAGPFVEELYFRGYLLPRMDGFSGKWAPLINTILFSLYHFFSPWENLIRIAASYPLIYLVWKKRNIRFSMLVHIIVNSVGGLIALITLLGR